MTAIAISMLGVTFALSTISVIFALNRIAKALESLSNEGKEQS